jgi:HAE1 family hydrophobic/amphiphilic exporter-1
MLEDRAGKDIQFLASNTKTFLEAARKRPELASANTTLNPGVPQLVADVDKDKALKQGVSLNAVYQALQAFLGGYFIDYFNLYGRVWQVYVQAEGEFRTRASDIGQFYVRNSQGNPVPLSALVTMRTSYGLDYTVRFNEYRAAPITATLAPGYSTQQGMKALEEVFARTMPREMGFDYAGMSFQENLAAQGIPASAIFGLSLLVVFLILAAQYESWSLPLGVLLGTPIAVFGAFAALWLRRLESDLFSEIGLVMIIGLAAKNAILIVEFSRAEHERGQSLTDAALAGARLRLRPILMTAFAFILGVLPLVIATGSGAASRRILGTTVLGGMVAATFIAIFIIPTTFYVSQRFGRRAAAPAAPPSPAPLPDGPPGSAPAGGIPR